MLERVEGFTLAENINNIDYETFVEAMMWISKQEDLKTRQRFRRSISPKSLLNGIRNRSLSK